MDGIDLRVGALEKTAERIDGKLDRLLDGLAEFRLNAETRFGAVDSRLSVIEAKLDSKASSAEVASIQGRMHGLADKWFVVRALGFIVALVAAIVAIGPKLAVLLR